MEGDSPAIGNEMGFAQTEGGMGWTIPPPPLITSTPREGIDSVVGSSNPGPGGPGDTGQGVLSKTDLGGSEVTAQGVKGNNLVVEEWGYHIEAEEELENVEHRRVTFSPWSQAIYLDPQPLEEGEGRGVTTSPLQGGPIAPCH